MPNQDFTDEEKRRMADILTDRQWANEAASQVMGGYRPQAQDDAALGREVLSSLAGYRQPTQAQPPVAQEAQSPVPQAAQIAADAQTAQAIAQTPQPAYIFRTNPYIMGGAAAVPVARPQTASDIQAENPQARLVLKPLSLQERALASQIAQQKIAFDQAKATGNQAGMDAAHDTAQGIRDYANQYNIDLSRFGADNASAAQMQGYLAADYANGIGNALMARTSDDEWNDTYQKLKANGYRDSVARSIASQRAGAYQSKRIQALGTAFTQYGINPGTGEMNDYGAGILSQMYYENPNAVSMLASYYATPIQQYQVRKNQEAADALYRQKLGLYDKQGEIQGNLIDKNGQWNINAINAQGDIQKFLGELQSVTQKYGADKTLEGILAMIAGGVNPKTGKPFSASSPSSEGSGEMKDNEKMLLQNANDIFEAAAHGDLHGDSINDSIGGMYAIKDKISDEPARQSIDAMAYALNALREFTAWNDNGQRGSSENARKWYEISAGLDPRFVSELGLDQLYNSAKQSAE